jgi:hypothetical protein
MSYRLFLVLAWGFFLLEEPKLQVLQYPPSSVMSEISEAKSSNSFFCLFLFKALKNFLRLLAIDYYRPSPFKDILYGRFWSCLLFSFFSFACNVLLLLQLRTKSFDLPLRLKY